MLSREEISGEATIPFDAAAYQQASAARPEREGVPDLRYRGPHLEPFSGRNRSLRVALSPRYIVHGIFSGERNSLASIIFTGVSIPKIGCRIQANEMLAGGMGGKEAAQHILAIDPKARLVVSSGYFDDPVLADYEEHVFCAIVPKPYKVADLAEVMSGLSNCAA